jgi:hypothetical protein
MALQESPKRTAPATPGVTAATHQHSETTDADSTVDRRARVRATLAANAEDMTHATGPDRALLLRRRAELWEELAQIDPPDKAQAHRATAAVCRQEADSLDPSSPNWWWTKKQHEVKNAA